MIQIDARLNIIETKNNNYDEKFREYDNKLLLITERLDSLHRYLNTIYLKIGEFTSVSEQQLSDGSTNNIEKVEENETVNGTKSTKASEQSGSQKYSHTMNITQIHNQSISLNEEYSKLKILLESLNNDYSQLRIQLNHIKNETLVQIQKEIRICQQSLDKISEPKDSTLVQERKSKHFIPFIEKMPPRDLLETDWYRYQRQTDNEYKSQ